MSYNEDFITKRDLLCTKLNEILPFFEVNVSRVVNVILLSVDKDTVDEFIRKVDKSFVGQLKKIIVTQNQICNAETHPIGVLISNHFNAGTAQKILNVKHLSTLTSKNTTQSASINTTTLHRKTRNLTWFRLRVICHKTLQLELHQFPHTYNIINTNIAEVVYETTKAKTPSINYENKTFLQYCTVFNASSAVEEIIFFSNCMDLATLSIDKNLVYSNIFKFYFCMLNNKLDTTFMSEDLSHAWNLQVHAALLQCNLNFNTNRSKSISPLGLLSSEKNNAAMLANFGWFGTGSPRDSLLLGEGSQVGGNSNARVDIEFATDKI